MLKAKTEAVCTPNQRATGEALVKTQVRQGGLRTATRVLE